MLEQAAIAGGATELVETPSTRRIVMLPERSR
jgi:hypothetical protein